MADEFLKPHRAKFDLVLSIVAQAHQLTPADVTRPGKTRVLMAAKRDAVALTIEILCPPFSQGSVGDWLNLSRSSLCRHLADAKARAAQAPEYAARVDALRARIRAALQLNTEDKPNG